MAKDPYRFFRVEARDLLRQMGEAVLAAEQAPAPDLPPRLLRLAHTLKGAASVVRLPAIAAQAHAIEDLLTPLRDADAAPGRAELDALLALIDAAEESITALDVPAAGAPATADKSRPPPRRRRPRRPPSRLRSHRSHRRPSQRPSTIPSARC
ncbi:Hpt domain-containing protein [Roseateles chitinivorans]|uniref:Hpt domain-containing protein n=1 Tax=Roseateles chitinivorans TaxID=2917965 RepID=UPI003D671183